MFEKVLFPTDFSDYSKKTVEYVWGLKGVGVEEIVLVHVMDLVGVEAPIAAQIETKLMANLEEIADKIRSHGLEVKSLLLSGVPFLEILRVSEEEEVNLIVAGSHGKSPLDEILLGSTSERIARKAKMPVLLIRYKMFEDPHDIKLEKFSEESFQKILYPTDFSVCSAKALDYIKRFTEVGMTEVVILNTIEPKKYDEPQMMENVILESQSKLDRIADQLKHLGIECTTIVEVGEPTNKLLEVSEREKVSMIAMGSRGRGLVQGQLLGSVSSETIRRAKRPLLLIHQKDVCD